MKRKAKNAIFYALCLIVFGVGISAYAIYRSMKK